MAKVTAYELARQFHNHYEELAPRFGYKTRPESRVPWSKVPSQNKRLMIEVAGEILRWLEGERDER